MPRYLNPSTVPQPTSRYAQGVLVAPAAKRLIISGQIGLQLDGTMAMGLPAQLEQAFDNMIALIEAAEMTIDDLVKVRIYCSVPGSIATVRDIRAKRLGNSLFASTYLEVVGFANRACLIEIEGEAVREAQF